MTESNNRPCVVAGNWKMYKTVEDAVAFVDALAPAVATSEASVFLAVPFTAIAVVAERAKESNIVIGAQNMHDATEGAFTGEIAGKMLVGVGAKFVILGHSERRHVFGESSEFVNRKVKRALDDGLQPILCVGETLEEREAGNTETVLSTQLTESLAGLDAAAMQKIIVAYEPVWAIGTGKTATPEMAQEAHLFCRKVLADTWSAEVADSVVIQYGGSVKPENAKVLMGQPDIDGVLVGGASLTPESFAQIVNYQQARVLS